MSSFSQFAQKRRGLEKLTYSYFEEWRKFKKLKTSCEKFGGLSLNEMSEFECFFRVSVDVYSINEEGNVQIVYKSSKIFLDKMKLNLFGKHLSYILNFSTYAKKFECRNCGKISNRIDHIRRHEKVCDQASKLIYPGGFLKQRRSFLMNWMD